MNSIELQQTLPAVFAGRDFIVSDVWHQSLQLKRGEAYLIEAASGTGKSSLLQLHIWISKRLSGDCQF